MPNKFAAAIVALIIVIATPAAVFAIPNTAGSDPGAAAPSTATATARRASTLDAWGMANDGLRRFGELLVGLEVQKWDLAAAHAHEAEARARTSMAPADASASSSGSAASSGSCGGELPPCWIMGRESGGNIRAQNPTSSASGKWQILDSTWNGFMGYARAGDAPEWVQDAKARTMALCNWQPPNYCGG